ncbi:hypothetical protein HF1_07370 [Mycoplasma haemofelis str. Langford 1]|uniref:Uncharacterized protein n=1 Tax=Mycoplasma haemofelis (strain Langford 1) TaxID=941640 RepID=E8ZHX4_MYCHL|nr:hypothetical protein [Mycoplasma haemofelis]CBY92745.1 hypothetical protein HF1_07370 [Mycoplasma haemofelis str. Langford 1]
MAFNAKLASAISAGTVGAAGSAYAGMKVLNSPEEKRETFGDKYKGTLITFGSEDTEKWGTRKSKLEQDNSADMEASLKSVKSKQSLQADDIKAWCSGVASSPFDSKSTKIKWFESYCVYTIKEKVGSKFITDAQSSSWTNANNSLKNKGKTNLPSHLQDVYDKLTASSADASALQKYCHSKQDDVFRGLDDSLYSEIATYCIQS